VCQAWRSAAAGCSGIRLLYQVGYAAADNSCAIWLGRNSQQLEVLIISSSYDTADKVLAPLADAAAAAVAAGRPLPLHTLRVLGHGPGLELTSRLLAALPNLTCLQLMAEWPVVSSKKSAAAVERHVALFQQATQLQELYLTGPQQHIHWDRKVPELLPASLKRLALANGVWHQALGAPDLSHLTQVTFLQLSSWRGQHRRGPLSAQLPPRLQQLQLRAMKMRPSQLQQEREVLTGFTGVWTSDEETQVQSSFTNISVLSAVPVTDLMQRKGHAVLQRLAHLSDLGVDATRFESYEHDLRSSVSAMCSMQGLRRLYLEMSNPGQKLGQLSALTQLTYLRVSVQHSGGQLREHRQQYNQLACAWAAELGRMPWLRWLSVPAVLLVSSQAWLGGLEQLRVLVLTRVESSAEHSQEVMSQVVQWLGKCDLQALPPRLLLLGFTGVQALQAVSQQQRRRLQARLGSRGCEVVVGADLDEVCHPVKQLAGVPVGLQQALA
jgi:hypothetical protein